MGAKEFFWSHFGAKKVFYWLYFGKTNYKDIVFARNNFFRLVRAPNESLILIIICYMFKYSVGIKTTLLESLKSQKKFFKGYISTNYMDLVLTRNDFLRLVGAPNESVILIIICYMFKYSVGIKTTLLESLPSQKRILKDIFRQN